MSEIPELEHALVEAARRHYRRGITAGVRRARRRWARPARLIAPTVGLALLIAGVVVVIRIAAPSGEERPAATPTATPSPGIAHLERDYAVFRRPRRSADALPGWLPRSPRYAVERSRLVGSAGGQHAFLIPARDPRGGPELCALTTIAANGVNGSCRALAPASADDGRAFVSRSRRMTDGAPLLLAVFRDGVTRLRIALRDGTSFDRAIRDNAVFAVLRSQAVALSWTDGSGRAHTQTLPGAGGTGDVQASSRAIRCPRLEPLPMDSVALAARAALAAQPRLYPATANPRVVSARPLRPGDRGGDLYAKCGTATGRRAIKVELGMTPRIRSASLSQGTLLLGVVGGRMRVVEQVH